MPVAILYTDGELQMADIQSSCRWERWIPVLVYRPRGQPEAVPTLILFHDNETARRFSKRNLPKDYLRGGVNLTPGEMAWVREKGWRTEYLTYPKVMNNSPDVELGYEVLEFQKVPDVLTA